MTGFAIIFLVSRREGRMIHCTVWHAVGTLVSYIKNINPFRIKIKESCTDCMRCSSVCRDDALTAEDILNRMPGMTCTLCGDCLSVYRFTSIKYTFPGVKPDTARKMYITTTLVIYSLVLAPARI